MIFKDIAREAIRGLDRRVLGLALAAVAGLALAANVLNAPPYPWAFDELLGVPGVISGALLLFASALAVALRRWGGHGPVLLAIALPLALVGVEQAGSLHERADLRLGLDQAVAIAPVCALAVLIVALAPGCRAPALPRAVLVAGAVLLLTSLLAEVAGDSRKGYLLLAGVLSLAGPGLMVIALLAALQSVAGWRPDESDRLGLWGAVRMVTHRVTTAELARFVAAGVGVFVVLGLAVNGAGLPVQFLDVRGEYNAPAAFSALLLFAAGLLALAFGRDERAAGRDSWGASAMGATFLFLGFDEIAALKDELALRTDVLGQIFLLPVVILGIAGWSWALRRFGPLTDSGKLLIAGAMAWIVSQIFDVSHEPVNHPLTVPEEGLEMAGSALFLLALFHALRELAPRPAARYSERSSAVPS
jgi:hypothetical protein